MIGINTRDFLSSAILLSFFCCLGSCFFFSDLYNECLGIRVLTSIFHVMTTIIFFLPMPRVTLCPPGNLCGLQLLTTDTVDGRNPANHLVCIKPLG